MLGDQRRIGFTDVRGRSPIQGSIVDREFEGLHILTGHWPVIVLDFPGYVLPDAALRSGLSYVDQLWKGAHDRGERTYGVPDLTRLSLMAPPGQRKLVAEWLSRTMILQKVVSLGNAVVTPSSFLRGLVTAIFWVATPRVPTVFVPTRSAAFAEAVKAFDAARVSLPTELRAALSGRRRAGAI